MSAAKVLSGRGSAELLDEPRAARRHRHDAPARRASQIAQRHEPFEQRRAECAGEVQAAFAPIETRAAQRPAPGPQRLEVDSESRAPRFASRCQIDSRPLLCL